MITQRACLLFSKWSVRHIGGGSTPETGQHCANKILLTAEAGSLLAKRSPEKWSAGVTTQTYPIAFLYERASDNDRQLTQTEQRAIEISYEALKNANHIIIRLGGKAGRLGECIVGTALLEGAFQVLRVLGKEETPVTILVDEDAGELFDEQSYRQIYWEAINVITVPHTQLTDLSEQVQDQLESKEHILILDFHGANDEMPRLEVDSRRQTITTIAHLFRVGVRSYAERGPQRRYADFIEDLFGLSRGTIDSAKAQPNILLSDAYNARYPELARRFDLDTEAIQIVCFFQSVMVAKCYTQWDQVMQLFCEYMAQHYPQQKINFLLASGPDELNPPGARLKDLIEVFADFSGVNNNARVLIHATPSLRDLAILTKHGAVALSNDTGPGHLAGALQIPTITPYLPGTIYTKEIWASSLYHRGVTLEPNPFSYQQIKAAILWDKTDIIDSIPPALLEIEMRKSVLSHMKPL